ncbi:MAG: hypothetical protein A2042_04595 [Candidatus Schekmanbacteria bacterium GWA2_38_11]|uniref:Uncharacterized protein n=1 Tax=Candidatus Schekmanbacteria bacterium GWA2_38_11 TaxID=1817876 RepID=A0A1F7RLW1_9BACT|nr:MAG: hypothetical protein A2042_04595 [Candidatus Schekmanbacteria bacterium GWA2_38_11]
MKTARLEIDISGDVYSTLEIKGYTKKKLAINLFSEGILSFGKAAQLAGLNKWRFMDLLREKKIPFYEPTEEEISEDIKREGRK